MNEQVSEHSEEDFFGEVLRRYFQPPIDDYPRVGATLVHRLMTSTDEIQDRLAGARHAAAAWSTAESRHAGLSSEFFLITQCGLMYAAGFSEPGRTLYYLAAPAVLFDPFVDQVEHIALRGGSVAAVDRGCSIDLSAAHPMDAALRRILDEHNALKVGVG